jgi:teichuronic acid biosynthesis glycosyltransferase TuaC
MMTTPGYAPQPEQPVKVLVLSRNYPNRVMEFLGLWAERLVRHSTRFCELKVVAPVPYVPPLPRFAEYYTRFRRIEKHRWDDGVEVFHPRFVLGPGYLLHSLEAVAYYLGVRRQVDQLRAAFPFDLIHAHFAYPDGVVAAWLGRRYGVPVVITEQAPWRPWLDDHPLVRRQTLWAAQESMFVIAISRFVRDTIVHFTHDPGKVRVIPDGVDGDVFVPLPKGQQPNLCQILYVGQLFFTKGIDILLQAMHKLVGRHPEYRLVLVGGNYYRNKQLQGEHLQLMAHDLGLGDRVEFVGTKPLPELVRLMQESAVLVLPSRAESFGCVLVEALACGTPVIATRCGGPEDIVTEQVGMLVPVGDTDALAQAIGEVVENREAYSPELLRGYALESFAWEQVARRTVDLYKEALDRFRK